MELKIKEQFLKSPVNYDKVRNYLEKELHIKNTSNENSFLKMYKNNFSRKMFYLYTVCLNYIPVSCSLLLKQTGCGHNIH